MPHSGDYRTKTDEADFGEYAPSDSAFRCLRPFDHQIPADQDFLARSNDCPRSS